ncbi:MAG: PLP-dependent aminotransferase family protein [Gemmatimonadetes bacterium]|nr:PLP-dependent aminotransferase family protein [Gemmatimonadota bacterium]
MLLLSIDYRSSTPAYRQISERVMQLAAAGTLPPGTRLPPTRTLAVTLGVHRDTVVRAYRELRALGYLESRPGSYTVMRQRYREPGARAAVSPGARLSHRAPTSAAPPSTLPEVEASHSVAGVIDFASHLPDPTLAPFDYLRRCMKRVLAGRDREFLVHYPDPRGLASLREAIAQRMVRHGVAVSADEIVVTNGAQQGLDLILRLFVRPGDGVAVESPTYGMALSLLRTARDRSRSPCAPTDWTSLSSRADFRVAPRDVAPGCCTPCPTSTTPRASRRRRHIARRCSPRPNATDFPSWRMASTRAQLLRSRGAPHQVDRCAWGRALPRHPVKLVFPGLRIGWIAAPRAVVDQLTALQRATSLGGNALAQALAARLYAGSEFDVHLRRIHRVYQRRMQAMADGLTEHLPPHVRWTRPQGGYLAWLQVTAPTRSEAELVARAHRAGVQVTPGAAGFTGATRDAFLRVSIACVDEGKIAEGCRRLGEALR